MNIAKVHLEPRRVAAVVLVLLVSIVASSRAQKFEELYGGACSEQGYGGDVLVRGGYVATGVTTSTNSGSCPSQGDIYVVKLKANGATDWARAYNIGGYDYGQDIRECANGDLIVLGNTYAGPLGNGDLVIMRLSSVNGAVLWTVVYGTTGSMERGSRIIEATLSAGGTTAAGDFVVAGSQSGANGSDGLLLRVKSTGGILWMVAYDGGRNDGLAGLDESTVGIGRSDILAAGSSTSFSSCQSTQGLVMRVSGRNGRVGVAPQGVAVYGRESYVDLTTVDELTVGNEAGNVVYAGYMSVGSSSDIYLLKTEADPCSTLADVTYGDADSTAELAHAIREIVSPAGGGLTNGNIMVAGTSKVYTEATGAQGFVMEVDPALVLVPPPAGAGYRLLGPGVEKMLWGEPVLNNTGVSTAGFFVIGYSLSFPTIMGDQMYLVKTDNLGVTDCYGEDYEPTRTRPHFYPNCVTLQETPVGQSVKPTVRDSVRRGDSILCNDSLRISGPGGGTGSDGGSGLSRIDARGGDPRVMMAAGDPHAIPVRAGTAIELGYRLEGADPLTVVVADMAGREVYRGSTGVAPELTQMTVPTVGWEPGSYLVSATCGKRTMVDRVLVGSR